MKNPKQKGLIMKKNIPNQNIPVYDSQEKISLSQAIVIPLARLEYPRLPARKEKLMLFLIAISWKECYLWIQSDRE